MNTDKFCHICNDHIDDHDMFWTMKIEIVSPMLERKTLLKYVCNKKECQGPNRFWLWQQVESERFFG